MQNRPKAIFGASAAFGVITAAVLMAPAPAFAADPPTFDKVPVANGFNTDDPVTLSGTAAPNTEVTLYEDAYNWASKYTVDQLKNTPAPDYSKAQTGPNTWPPVTTTSNASGRWSITRPMDSGHIMMVGTKDGFSNRRYAAVRVQAGLSAEPNGAGAVSFQVNVNPGQAGFPVTIQRYNGTAWVQAGTGVTSGEGAAAGWGDVLTDLPAGAHTFRAYVGNFTDGDTADEKADFASATNLVIANYSNNVRVTVAGTPANDSAAPSGGNPTPNPTIADPDGGPVDNPNPGPSSANPSPSKPSTGPSKPPTTPTTPKPTTPAPPAGPAAGSVQVTKVQFNAPGKDTTKNKSVNGEYFRLTNKTKKTINLTGWSVRDRAGNIYRFRTTYYLGAGKSVYVHTGKGTNKSTTRYWTKTKHVWNNGGDIATLRTNAGKWIDSCWWTKPGKGYTNC